MIIEHVTRDRHPKDLHHPVRYADLEGLFVDPGGKERLYLSLHFGGAVLESVPEHRQSKRPGRQKAGLPGSAAYVQLLRVHHHPDPTRVKPPADTPWAEDDKPRVMFADVLPLERKLTEWFPSLRAQLCDVLAPRLGHLQALGPNARWLVHVALLPESAELEVGTTTWTELLRNEEAIERLPLA